jgi:hypothetical protein
VQTRTGSGEPFETFPEVSSDRWNEDHDGKRERRNSHPERIEAEELKSPVHVGGRECPGDIQSRDE